MSGISQLKERHIISGISWEHFRKLSDIFRLISGKFYAGKSQTCLRHISCISQAYLLHSLENVICIAEANLRHTSGITQINQSMVNVRHITGKLLIKASQAFWHIDLKNPCTFLWPQWYNPVLVLRHATTQI